MMKLVDGHNRTVFVRKNLIQMLLVHVFALAVAPFLFTWGALGFAFVFTLLFAYSMGIFHHMLFTHKSFECKNWIRNMGGLFGTLSWRGPFAGPVQYVAGHKVHHQYADTDLDPHTPTKGLFHAWIGWFWHMPYGLTKYELYKNYAERMARQPFMVFLDQNVDLLQLVWGALCFVGGGLLSKKSGFDWENATRFAVYGVFVKTFLLVHMANAVDVINHTVGYRSYETPDQSTNSFIMAAVHLGGAISWHNNHHAHQGYFNVRKNWWEFDVHHEFLKLLQLAGWVWDIKILDEVTSQRKKAL